MSSSDSGSAALGRFPFPMDFSTENPQLFLRRCQSMFWINAMRDEGYYSSPFFFRIARTIFLMISCSSTGVISSIFLFSSQASRYCLKIFYVVHGFLLRVLVFNFFSKLFNFLVADEHKPARQAFILNNKRDARNHFNKSKRREQ